MTIRIFLVCMSLVVTGIKAQIKRGIFRTPAGNQDYHQFTRSGGGATVYINQTDSVNAILCLSSKSANANSHVVFTVENTGNTGIGTSTPSTKLSIAGGISLFSALTNTMDRPTVSARMIPGEIRGMNATSPIRDDGFLGLSAGGGTKVIGRPFIDLSGYTTPCTLGRFENIVMGTTGVERLRITNASYVGIGNKKPKEKLSVNGNVQAKEIRVPTAADWSDYVFDSSYQLMPLSELERKIAAKGHLPGFPSGGSISKSGIELGLLNQLLTKKVEELTLCTVIQQKLPDEQSSTLQKQEEQLQEFSLRFKQLEEAVRGQIKST